MTLLEVITNAASTNSGTTPDFPSNYPIILNPDESLLALKPNFETDPDPNSPVIPVSGFQISRTDTQTIDSNNQFIKKLKKKIKNPDEFLTALNGFLEKMGEKLGISIGLDESDKGYSCKLIEKLGFLMGREVCNLVVDACVAFEIWNILECLIINGFVEHCYYSNLVRSLVDKKRSDLLCACIMRFLDLKSVDLLIILRFFLVPSRDGFIYMVEVRKEWESQALLAIEKCKDKSLKGQKMRVANEAVVLLMIAYDGFSSSELCLHYLLASGNVDELVLTSAISKLNGLEMMALIRYLGKWLKKYERFPQAGPCPKAASMLGLKACDWVPRIEDVIKCLGLVIDEQFSSLVLHPEFHEEVKSIGGAVSSLALEARLCGSLACMVENLRNAEMTDTL